MLVRDVERVRKMISEYNRPYIVAIDFDGTICLGGWPDVSKGTVNPRIMSMIQQVLEDTQGNVSFVLWTCRHAHNLEAAVDFCNREHIPIDFINEDHPTSLEWSTQSDNPPSPKIFADEYWDDKAVHVS